MLEDLKRKRLDVAIGALPVTNDLASMELLSEKILFAAHKKFCLIPQNDHTEYSPQNPCIIHAEQLDGLPFIIPQTSNALYNCFEEILQGNRFRPSRTISVNNLNTGLLLNIKGLGVQLLISSFFDFNQEPGIENLDFFCLENMPHTRKCLALFHEDSAKKKLVSDFIQSIQNEVID